MNIRELMSGPPVTCRQSDTLAVAARLMWDHDCGVIPVTDDRGRLTGIVTDRDICMATYTQGKAPQAIHVAEVMTTKVFSCRVDDPLELAEQIMGERQIRRLPVIDGDNRPIGVLSVNDIARYVASASKKDGIEHEVVTTLASIGKPRQDVTQIPPKASLQVQPGARA